MRRLVAFIGLLVAVGSLAIACGPKTPAADEAAEDAAETGDASSAAEEGAEDAAEG
ncbi:MAG TPA: hypothetical protein VEI97_03395 [bacterium]|nr:hypothetical protein [bacterium]